MKKINGSFIPGLFAHALDMLDLIVILFTQKSVVIIGSFSTASYCSWHNLIYLSIYLFITCPGLLAELFLSILCCTQSDVLSAVAAVDTSRQGCVLLSMVWLMS